jgi:hypothetical protein
MAALSPYPMAAPRGHAEPAHEADIRLLPLLHQQQAEAALQQHHHHQQQQQQQANMLHIDPAMQAQPVPTARGGAIAGFRARMAPAPVTVAGQHLDDGMRQELLERYARLQREMEEVRTVLLG